MKHRIQTVLVLAGLGLALASIATAAIPGAPKTVSPGSPGAIDTISASCPTFSWAAISETKGIEQYELVVYRVKDQMPDEKPMLRQLLSGTASSWTPPLGQCLEHGGSYAWSLRALSKKDSSSWSEPSLFAVQAASAASAASAGTPSDQAPEVFGWTVADQAAQNAIAASMTEDASLLALQFSAPSAAAAAAGHDLGNLNTTTGVNALTSLTTGVRNTANGALALQSTSTGSGNTGSGALVLRENTSGTLNTAAGDQALRFNTDGSFNIAFGALSLLRNVNGTRNTAVGSFALRDNTIGISNTAVGSSALRSSSFTSFNTAVGGNALLNTTGAYNTGLGTNAGVNATSGSHNIFIRNPGLSTDNRQIKIGIQGTQTAAFLAGIFGTPLVGSPVVVTASGQLGTGTAASPGFNALTSGTNTSAGMVVGSGASLSASGTGTIAATTAGSATSAASAATALTATALAANGSDCPTGQFATGIDAMGNATGCSSDDHDLGSGNTGGIGVNSLANNTTGSLNTSVGSHSLYSNTSGYNNTGIGVDTLANNTAGGNNTALGTSALKENVTGVNNTAVGWKTMRSNTVGFESAAFGHQALEFNTSGIRNTAMGPGSLYSNTTGTYNTALGFQAGINNTTGSSSLFLANPGSAADDKVIKIGIQGSQLSTFLAGIYGTPLAGSPVVVDASGQLGTGMAPSPGFDAVTSGTNTMAAMVVGNGASLSATGLGTIAATTADSATTAATAAVAATAGTATALAADGSDCPPGEFAIGVDDMGNAQGCAVADTDHGFASANTRVGTGALMNNTSGSNNTGLGYQSLSANTLGSYNTATGQNAMQSTTTGGGNSAFGAESLQFNTAGTRNTAVGSRALRDNTTGERNVAVGHDAMINSGTGSYNTAVGVFSLLYTSTGTRNTGLGFEALRGNTSGTLNTAVGYRAGRDATTSSDSIFIANQGLAADSATIKIGSQGTQLSTFLAGIYGTPLAGSPVVVDASGQLGTGTAPSSGFDAVSSGTNTTASMVVGNGAFLSATGTGTISATTADSATTAATAAVAATAGTATALAADGSDCPPGEFAIGVDDMGNAQGCAIADTDHGFATANTRVGTGALTNNTSGVNNTALGNQALSANTVGSTNTAAGQNAMRNTTSGEGNSAFGAESLQTNTTGTRNTAVGSRALRDNTTGQRNVAVGHDAMIGSGTGSYNTAVGSFSLLLTNTGTRNTGFGFEALRGNTSGTLNTAVGYRAGRDATVSSNSIFIANQGLAADTATIKIGTQGTQTSAFLAGVRGITTGLANAIPVMVDSAGQFGTVSSSIRYKEDVADMGAASAAVLELRPVTFRYKEAFANGEKPIQFGLIAEEVAKVFPELAVYNEDGEPETVKYHLLSAMLLNELQKLHADLAAEKLEVAQLTARLTAAEAEQRQVSALAARVSALEESGGASLEAARLAADHSAPATANQPAVGSD